MKRFFLKKHTVSFHKGFTLLESLIAIAVLAFAITATFTAAQSGLSSAMESKDQVIGFHLASEAVEYVRNLRDSNALAGNHWLYGFAEDSSDPCYPGKACTLDVAANTLVACPTGPGSCSNLRQDRTQGSSTYGMYGNTGSWALSNFKREIVITQINSDEISVSVVITATKGAFSRTYTVKESILNWQS